MKTNPKRTDNSRASLAAATGPAVRYQKATDRLICLVVFLLLLVTVLADYLIRPVEGEMATTMVLNQLIGAAGTDIATFFFWRVLVPVVFGYCIFVWPITRVVRRQRSCYVGEVYKCRNHPGRCFDCRVFDAVEKVFVLVERAAICVKRLFRGKKSRQPHD